MSGYYFYVDSECWHEQDVICYWFSENRFEQESEHVILPSTIEEV